MPEHTPAPTPSRAVYGFVMFLSFKTFFLLYVVWALIPDNYFQLYGISCLPHRYWAVTIPIFLIISLGIFAFVIYPYLRYFMTPNPSDIRTIRDLTGMKTQNEPPLACGQQNEVFCCCSNEEYCRKGEFEAHLGECRKRPDLVLRDLNIWDVSNHLYLK